MGLFGKLFKKEEDFFSISYMAKQFKKLNNSFNYQFVFKAVKLFFFKTNFDELYLNDSKTQNFLKYCADYVVMVLKVRRDERFFNLKYYYANNSAGDRSIIVEFKGPWTVETECNFIALHKDHNGEMCIYTSEYYVSAQKFELCQEKPDIRYNLSGNGIITDLQSFTKAIKQTVVR